MSELREKISSVREGEMLEAAALVEKLLAERGIEGIEDRLKVFSAVMSLRWGWTVKGEPLWG